MATVTSDPQSGERDRIQQRGHPWIATRRFQLVSALIIVAFAPIALQLFGFPAPPAGATRNVFAANTLAVLLAFWMRLSIEVYPGIRRSYVIVPTVLAGHGLAFAALLISRHLYVRPILLLALALHVAWLYLLYVLVERRVRRRIAVVPSGGVRMLAEIDNVEWHWLKRTNLNDARGCGAIVADFGDLPGKWEQFLAEAAIAGRIVYQHKQLAEALTGRVELEHLSENTFGSLLPSRGYFYIKGCMDFLAAIAVLPLALPVMAVIALAIALEGRGSPLFRQTRVGHGGREFIVYKFRTMLDGVIEDARTAATTADDDSRITKVGRILRKYRLDELPQIFNVLRWEMSWIGPRPEAQILSAWYKNEIPFYHYRHVVKPGISGWAQVNQGHVATIDDIHLKLQFDFYYIKYFSPWLDLLIVLRTIKTMITGFGSK